MLKRQALELYLEGLGFRSIGRLLVTAHPIGTLISINIGLVAAYRVPEMRGIVLRSVLPVREQDDNEADSVPCEQLRLLKFSHVAVYNWIRAFGEKLDEIKVLQQVRKNAQILVQATYDQMEWRPWLY